MAKNILTEEYFVLKDLVVHDYYQLFDCEKQHQRFSGWLCIESKEWLEYVDFLIRTVREVL